MLQPANQDSHDHLRIPPHSIDAERSVLGGLLIDNEAFDTVSDLLTPEDFYSRQHHLIYAACLDILSAAQPLDVVTLAERLTQRNQLDECGEMAYLGELVRQTPSAFNIKAYADIVRGHSIVRQLIKTANQIASDAFAPEGRSTEVLLDKAEQRIFAIAERSQRTDQGFVRVNSVLSKVVDRIDAAFESDSQITGLATGFVDLDEQTAGLQPADLIILAGRPSMGKTTMAMNIAEHVAIKENKPVAVFSMEMPADSLAMRMLSSLGHIDQHRLRTGRLQDEDWPRLTSAISLLNSAPLFIDDTGGLTTTEIRTRARRLMREHGLSLIVVDYLQLMQSGSHRSENRATEISEISRSLKALAKELGIPIVALSQLNRSLETRPNKRPVMSDLRESGAIEQDADMIVFVYRDEVYNEDSPDKGKAEIIIGKQRNGPIGTVALTFQGKYTRFSNFAPSGSHDYYD